MSLFAGICRSGVSIGVRLASSCLTTLVLILGGSPRRDGSFKSEYDQTRSRRVWDEDPEIRGLSSNSAQLWLRGATWNSQWVLTAGSLCVHLQCCFLTLGSLPRFVLSMLSWAAIRITEHHNATLMIRIHLRNLAARLVTMRSACQCLLNLYCLRIWGEYRADKRYE